MSMYHPPTEQERDRILFEAEALFSPIRARLPKNWNSRANFDSILMNLDKSSSPGWPLCQESSTIGKWLFPESFFPDKFRAEQLWNMVQCVLRGDYLHAFKVFIKQEPHTLKKAGIGRWRLIMMSSLPVQIAWHMTVSHLLKKTLATTGDHPLRHGMVYYGGGWKRFHAENLQLERDYALDMSAWDWNSHGWTYSVMRTLYERLTVGATQEWKNSLEWLFRDAFFEKKLILPSGQMIQQVDDGGLMPSGLVPTIDLNGAASQLVDILARLRLGMPLDKDQVRTGDDALMRKPPSVQAYISELERAGCVVKEHFQSEEFMGFDISARGYFPKYLGKHIFNLLHQKDEFLSDSVDGYLRIYVFDKPMFNLLKRFSYELGIDTKSEGYYEYFATHPDALETGAPGVFFKDTVDGPFSLK